MMNRVRIYSSVRSGARITRYGGAGKSAPGRPVSPPAYATTFRPVAPSLVPRQLAAEVARTPSDRPGLEKTLGGMLESYRERLRQAGGPQHDVARAAAYFIAASHTVYFDTEPLSQEQFDALREHLREVYAADEKFRRASDRERQQMFETFGIMGSVIDAGFLIVKKADDRDGMRYFRELARENLLNMLGAPPEQVKFTLNGIEYR
jgi:hypothetical protein